MFQQIISTEKFTDYSADPDDVAKMYCGLFTSSLNAKSKRKKINETNYCKFAGGLLRPPWIKKFDFKAI
jgi:hypothetical protein